jgi:hypothetical protein
VLAGVDKFVDNISKKAVGTSGPNASAIDPGETPLGKRALRNLQPFQISEERNLPKIKSLHHVHQVRNPLRNLQPFQSCKKRNLPKIKLYTTYSRQASP